MNILQMQKQQQRQINQENPNPNEAYYRMHEQAGIIYVLVKSKSFYAVMEGRKHRTIPNRGFDRTCLAQVAHHSTYLSTHCPSRSAAPGSDYGMSLFGVVQAQQGLWLGIWQPLSALIFLVALFAETNRLPFDMAESETDLVGGFHTEYGAFKFGLFFVAEYAHIIMGSALFVTLFLGGWNFLPFLADPWGAGWIGSLFSIAVFMGKVAFMVFFFIWMRWTLPRFRYDQVMSLGWSILLPLAIANLVFNTLLIALIDTL